MHPVAGSPRPSARGEKNHQGWGPGATAPGGFGRSPGLLVGVGLFGEGAEGGFGFAAGLFPVSDGAEGDAQVFGEGGLGQV